jgi:hypothetical protein
MVEMARHVRTTIRYDGPELARHEMDVQDLAPALLALADIIQIANRKFNGDQADMRVLVNADVEQKCFMIDLSLVQSLLDQAKTFFGQDEVRTAKEIAEWVGIIGGGSGVAAGGLFTLLKLLRQRADSGTTFKVEQDTGSTTVTVIGNGNTVVVPVQTYQLAQEKSVVERVKDVVRPLQKPGYESLAFIQKDQQVFEIDDKEAAELIASPPGDIGPLPTESIATIRGTVRIKSAQYEGAARWAFMWNGRAIDADMTERAAEWVKDFQENRISAPPNSVLEVTMTETVKLDDRGEAMGKRHYAVQDVHSVSPPPQQGRLV